MAGFLEVVGVAFVLQLLALPGEKGQLVIAGLATRYHPYAVVAGAATAFGGWTAVEIALGRELKGALPAGVLEWATAVLFVLFAIALLWSLRESDGGSDHRPRSTRTDGGAVATGRHTASDRLLAAGDRLGGYGTAFAAMVVGEFGDKTQLITIALAVRYGAHPGIWVGEMLAIVPVSVLTAVVVSRSTGLLDARWLRGLSAALFLAFAADIAAARLIGLSVLPL